MVYRRLIRGLKQLEGWRPGCQKWQPEVNVVSLSVLRLNKYATFDILKFSIIASLAGNTSARGLLLTWDKRDSPKRTTFSSARVKMWEKHLHHAFFKLTIKLSVMVPVWCTFQADVLLIYIIGVCCLCCRCRRGQLSSEKARKASLVSISAAILLLRFSNVYFLLEFEFRKKSCVEWEHGGEDGISCLLPCIL